MTLWVVVLAGGASARFGTDKLEATVGGQALLVRAVSELPPAARLVVVGPVRDRLAGLGRPIAYVREDPPGGGPAAAIVAGLLAVAASSAEDLVAVLPGDTPAAGRAAMLLLDALTAERAAVAAVGVDAAGREQPLQLALRPGAVSRLVAAAGPGRGAGASARALVATLGEDLRRVPLPAELHADIDTPVDLAAWESRHQL